MIDFTLYISLAEAAIKEIFNGRGYYFTDLEIFQPVLIGETESKTLQIVMQVETEKTLSFKVYSRNDAAWTLNTATKIHLEEYQDNTLSLNNHAVV